LPAEEGWPESAFETRPWMTISCSVEKEETERDIF